MAPNFKHGKGALFKMSDSAAATINYSSGLDDCSLSRQLETAEVTTFGDNDKNYIPGLRDSSFSVSGHWASTYAKKLDASLGWSTLLTWTYWPESTATGSLFFTGAGILTGYEVGASVGDKVNLSFSVQCSGAITRSTE
jgi:hypothetical protein